MTQDLCRATVSTTHIVETGLWGLSKDTFHFIQIWAYPCQIHHRIIYWTVFRIKINQPNFSTKGFIIDAVLVATPLCKLNGNLALQAIKFTKWSVTWTLSLSIINVSEVMCHWGKSPVHGTTIVPGNTSPWSVLEPGFTTQFRTKWGFQIINWLQ